MVKKLLILVPLGWLRLLRVLLVGVVAVPFSCGSSVSSVLRLRLPLFAACGCCVSVAWVELASIVVGVFSFARSVWLAS